MKYTMHRHKEPKSSLTQSGSYEFIARGGRGINGWETWEIAQVGQRKNLAMPQVVLGMWGRKGPAGSPPPPPQQQRGRQGARMPRKGRKVPSRVCVLNLRMWISRLVSATVLEPIEPSSLSLRSPGSRCHRDLSRRSIPGLVPVPWRHQIRKPRAWRLGTPKPHGPSTRVASWAASWQWPPPCMSPKPKPIKADVPCSGCERHFCSDP